MSRSMPHVFYTFISPPNRAQVGSFLRTLESRGFPVSHLGKSEPPPVFKGTNEEAVSQIFSAFGLTDYSFIRSHAQHLDLSLQVQPRGSYSTVTGLCPDADLLKSAAKVSAGVFDLYLCIRGRTELGSTQRWDVLYVTDTCPPELRARYRV